MEKNDLRLSVSDFIALTNQTLEYAYAHIYVEGEVAGFKINQGKYVFFDLKDETGSVGCFMMLWQQRMPIQDGMKVVVAATPKLTAWGKFSLTVSTVHPSGEGNLKKSFELLKAKLDKEGLFAADRKRPLPFNPGHVAVIASTQSAGYADFVKIMNDRWGGVQIDVAHVQVQGNDAPDQIIRALRYFNTRQTVPQVIAIIRGGGSADDLAAFNDELLVREIAASRVPTVVGVGHETDTSLADMAADIRAATPSNAAQLIVPDRRDMQRRVWQQIERIVPWLYQIIESRQQQVERQIAEAFQVIQHAHQDASQRLIATKRLLNEMDPRRVLERGYALLRGSAEVGSSLRVETHTQIITTEVIHVDKK